MLRPDVQRIAKMMAKPVEDFAFETGGLDPYAYEMKKTPEGRKCVFLESHSCTIYRCRPVICRFYPFEFGTTDNGTGHFRYTEECPGISRGRHALCKPYFDSLLRQLEKAGTRCSRLEPNTLLRVIDRSQQR